MMYLRVLCALCCLLLAACTQTTVFSSETPAQKQILLADGALFQMDASEVTAPVGTDLLQRYMYNEQTPGPLLRVRQGSRILVNFTNNLPEPTTVHWHGLRHEQKDDGMPGLSQEPVQPGASHLYTLHFPDDGVFWYHPHIREDRQQDMGLYGNIIVDPVNFSYATVAHEEILMLDDLLLEDGAVVPYGAQHANFALMGRYGNVLLINGQPNYRRTLKEGDVIRYYITSAANARPFNISFGIPVKLIGGDIGRYEQDSMVESIVLGPAERAIIELSFSAQGAYKIRNTNLWEIKELGEITVLPGEENPLRLAHNDVDVRQYESHFGREPDHTLHLGVGLKKMMHGGMMMHSVTEIEWEDTMQEQNHASTTEEVTWFLQDEATGKRNMDLQYHFPQGSVQKLRIVNDIHSPHPMQHVIHLHGQRFLVLEQNGVRNQNLVWKDTVMVPTGGTADILLDASNPGTWMIHCHIAEHLESGMMATFTVGNNVVEHSMS